MDRKPDMRQIKFSDRVNNENSTDAYKSTQAINSVNIQDPGHPPRTYTEFLNATIVLDGSTDYYKIMSDVGGKALVARAEFDKVRDSLNPKETKFIGKWLGQADMGLNYIHELHVKEDAQFKLKPPSSDPPLKYLSDCFGHPVNARKHDFPDNLKNSNGNLFWHLKTYDEPDLDGTVKPYSFQLGGDDVVRAKWIAALDEYYKQARGAKHEVAIDAFAQSREAVIPF